ncbi:MAG: hypothetical protein E6K82_23160 [Candidatus Rokuibacteriota bacterium]|nr:MAG: hypothetical protein E6K82_23160 [Candidatus Rokubacteria bacterium]
MIVRAWWLTALLLTAAPSAAHAQIFFADKPNPTFTLGPLFVRAGVDSKLGRIPVDVMFSVVVPPNESVADVEQDLYLLWPGDVVGDRKLGAADPALEKDIAGRGFTVIGGGRLALTVRNLYQVGQRAPAEPLPGGAPFVTFVREGGALGLSSPASWIRIPWNPKFANRVYLIDLHMDTRGLIKDKAGTWFEHTFWGPRHRLTLSFNEIRHRAVFPMYFQQRDRVVKLAEDPAQLIVNFADADHLKIDEMFPQSARRQLSETLESTETVSLFLDRSEGLQPQVLTVQFGYFTRLQSWAPVLIPALFFALGNGAGVLLRNVAERISKRWTGRVEFGRAKEKPRVRTRGVVLEPDTLRRIVPGVTTYEQVLQLCGRHVEELSRLTTPDHRTLVYRGRRIVPRRRRALSWLATIEHWDAEDHEVDIELERDVVRDVQARVRRSRLSAPEPA